eukprot:572780-Hanusia_phi.AAC.2
MSLTCANSASEFFQRLGSADDFSRLPSQYSYRITRTTSWDRFSAVPSAGMQAILEGLDEEDLERSQSTSSVTTATSMNYKDYVKTMREFKKREREKLRQARAEQEAKEREMEEGAATSSANEDGQTEGFRPPRLPFLHLLILQWERRSRFSAATAPAHPSLHHTDVACARTCPMIGSPSSLMPNCTARLRT